MTVATGLALVGAGVVVGIVSALFGVGGGTVMVPVMVLFFDQSQHVAQGTSLLVIVPTAVAGVLAHRRSGLVSFTHAALLGLGGVAGANLGSRIALDTSTRSLELVFAALLFFVGGRFIVQGLRARSSDGRPTSE